MTDGEKVILGACVAVGAAIVSGVFAVYNAWKTRTANEQLEKFKSEANLELEKFKGLVRSEIDQTLQNERIGADRRLEALRHDLRREATVHEIKFRKLYDSVAMVITGTFRRAARAKWSGLAALQAHQEGHADMKEIFTCFAKDFNELHRYIFHTRIFLPHNVHAVINEFMEPLRKAAFKFRGIIHTPGEGFWNEAVPEFTQVIMPLYEKLCLEIQEFIGVMASEDAADIVQEKAARSEGEGGHERERTF